MGVKSIAAEPKTTGKKKFPKIMACITKPTLICLMISASDRHLYGTVLVSEAYEIGSFHDNWGLELFEDFNEPVTIQND